MAATEVRTGDADYARLVAKWEEEGQASSFEEIGRFGGRLWKILRDGDEVTFLLHAAAGPTDPGQDKPIGWEPTSGYFVEMADTGLRIREGPGGENDLRFKMCGFPKDTTI